MSDLFFNNAPIVARQAIFDIDLNVYAYEWLFRSYLFSRPTTYEQGLWDEVNIEHVSFDQLGKLYLNATEWTIETQSSL